MLVKVVKSGQYGRSGRSGRGSSKNAPSILSRLNCAQKIAGFFCSPLIHYPSLKKCFSVPEAAHISSAAPCARFRAPPSRAPCAPTDRRAPGLVGPAAASASQQAETSPSSLHWCAGQGMTGCSPACRCAGLAPTSAFFGRRPSVRRAHSMCRARGCTVPGFCPWGVTALLALLVIADGSRAVTDRCQSSDHLMVCFRGLFVRCVFADPTARRPRGMCATSGHGLCSLPRARPNPRVLVRVTVQEADASGEETFAF